MIVQFQYQRNFTGVPGGSRLQESQGGSVGVTSGLNRYLEVVVRVVACRVDGEAPRRTMLEALVDRQNHEFAGPGKVPMVEQASDIGFGSGVITFVPA